MTISASTANPAPSELGPADFKRILEEVRPKIRDYGWLWKPLRVCAQLHPRLRRRLYDRLYRFLAQRGDPERPYFIGTTSWGVSFLGDYRDRYAIQSAVWPNHDELVVNSLRRAADAAASGAYVDVGTNMGVVATSMAQHLKGRGTVLAFEPLPATVVRAAATFALNSVENIRFFPMALGSEEGEISFFEAVGCSEGASAHPTDFGNAITWQETRVLSRTLDNLVEEGVIPKTGLLKLDVEGHEYEAVRGAKKLIARDHPTVIFEYFPKVAQGAGWVPTQLTSILSEVAPYRFEVVGDGEQTSSFPPPADSQEIVNIRCVPETASERRIASSTNKVGAEL